jgi:hypothetical protein
VVKVEESYPRDDIIYVKEVIRGWLKICYWKDLFNVQQFVQKAMLSSIWEDNRTLLNPTQLG